MQAVYRKLIIIKLLNKMFYTKNNPNIIRYHQHDKAIGRHLNLYKVNLSNKRLVSFTTIMTLSDFDIFL